MKTSSASPQGQNFGYGFGTTLSGLAYDDGVERTKSELKKEGFGVLTEIDIQATLKKKLDVDFRRYLILGACNPALAHQALQAEAHIGLLLPCNVVVQETAEGKVTVSIADPEAMFALVQGATKNEGAAHAPADVVALEAGARLRRVIDAIASNAS